MSKSTGIVFDAAGIAREGWTWSTDDDCAFPVRVYAGGTVVLIEDGLSYHDTVALHRRLHTLRLDAGPALRERARVAIPADVTPREGEALVYMPATHTLESWTEHEDRARLLPDGRRSLLTRLRDLPPLPSTRRP